MNRIIISVIALTVITGCRGSNSEQLIEQPKIQPSALPSKPTPPVITPPAAKADYIGFESAPVRPIAISSSGKELLVTYTSNNSLDTFSVSESGVIQHSTSVSVGLEPALDNNLDGILNANQEEK